MTEDYRSRDMERRLDQLEAGRPNAVVERLANLAEDMAELREELRWLRRALIGFFISISLILVSLTASNFAQ